MCLLFNQHPRRTFMKEVKYEAPRLQTYGKLEELTKGTLAGSTDTDAMMKP